MTAESGTDVVTVLMTAPDIDVAESVVRGLLEDRLIACGNLLPGAVSLYRWEGDIQRDEETVVVLKTLRRLVPRLLERAGGLHPYDVPELLVQPVLAGCTDYLEWVENECR